MDGGQVVIRLITDPSGAIAGFGAAAASAQGFSAKMGAVGSAMTRSLTVPIVAAGAASVVLASKFHGSMRMIQTQAGGSARDVEVLSEAVLKLGTNSQHGPQELSEALYHLKSVQMDNTTAMDALTQSERLASVGHADLEQTTNAVAGAYKSGIKGSQDFSKMVGTLNAVIGAGNLRMEDLNSAMGTGFLVTAQTFGVSLKSVGSALAMMTSRGIPATRGATALKMAITGMAAPSKAAEQEMARLHVSSKGLATDLRQGGINKALTTLKQSMEGMSKTDSSIALTKMFGARSSQAILTLIANLEDYGRTEAQVAKNSGNFGKLTAKQAEGAGAKYKQLMSKLSSLAIKFGDVLLPVALDLANGLNKVAGAMAKMGPGGIKAGLGILAVVALAGPVQKMIGPILKLSTAIKALMVASSALPSGAPAVLPKGGVAPGLAPLAGSGTLVGGAWASAFALGAIAAIPVAAVGITTAIVKAVDPKAFSRKASATQKDLAGGAGMSAARIVQQSGAITAQAGALKAATGQARMLGTAMDDVVNGMAKGTTSMKSGRLALSGYTSQLQQLRKNALNSGNKELAGQITNIIHKFKGMTGSMKSSGTKAVFNGATVSAKELGRQIDVAKNRASDLRNQIKVQQKLNIDTSQSKKALADTNAHIKKLSKTKAEITVKVNTKALSSASKLGLGASGGIGATFSKAGTQASANLAKGIQSGSGRARSAGASVGKNAVAGARGAVAGATSIGSSLSSGIASGIDVSAAVGPAVAVVQNAMAAARSAADAHSPSRKMMKLGSEMSQGLSIGITMSTSEVVKAGTQMALLATKAISKALGGLKGKNAKKVKTAGELAGPIGSLLDFIISSNEALQKLSTMSTAVLPATAKQAAQDVAKMSVSMSKVIQSELNKAFPKAKTVGRGKRKRKVGGGQLRDLLAAAGTTGPLGSVLGVVSTTLDILQAMKDTDPSEFIGSNNAFAKLGVIVQNMATTMSASLSTITVPNSVLTAASRLQTLADSFMSVLEVMKSVRDVDAGSFGTTGWSNLVSAAGGMTQAASNLPSLSAGASRGLSLAGDGAGGDVIIVEMDNVYCTNPAQAGMVAKAVATKIAVAKKRTERSKRRK